jgi:hypothetical protein
MANLGYVNHGNIGLLAHFQGIYAAPCKSVYRSSTARDSSLWETLCSLKSLLCGY